MRISKIYRKAVHPAQLISGLILSYALFFLLFFALLNKLYPLDIPVEYSTVVVSSDGHLLHAFLTSDDKWRMFIDSKEISGDLKKAIIFKEDKYFYRHPGINPLSLARALLNNIKEKRRTSGASTITMQVARMLEPKERNYRSKFIEIFRAFQLEQKLSKDEILQLYLNLVPYGGNVEGVKSASVIYFEKMPNHLSIAEITALSIIPNRPVSLKLGENNAYILEERNQWLRRFGAAGLFPGEAIRDALTEPLEATRHEVPHLAPQLCLRLKSSYPGEPVIQASIDLELQRKAERLVGSYSRRLYFQNIKNATALVVDNKTRRVLAYIGSADFDNAEDGGQVDGIQAIRSPGSTLKPLLYGLAMDLGIVTPKTVVYDVPISFSGYEPENYDDNYRGAITIEEALASSLNIPAVNILDKVGPDIMMESLSYAGFRQIKRERGQLGLSLILGGCGVRLEELVALYASFANEGEYEPLQLTQGEAHYQKKQILSAAASFMITEILTKLERPDLPVAWESSQHTPKIAWKTGTSYGRRDAWSIGYNHNYTIGVWLGNFSGEGVPDLSGSEKATPLLFQLFNAIDSDPEEAWFRMPDELDLRYVCSASGMLPGEYCTDDIIDYFIPGISDTRTCEHLKKILINPDSSLSYCTACKPEFGYIDAVYPNLPPEMISFYEESTIPYKKIPPHNPECERLLTGSDPKITSPIHENDYFVNILDSSEIMLSCQTSNDVQEVFWYINKKYYDKCKADEKLFFLPNEGKVEISCSDDKGRNSSVWITVKYTSF
ncbi:MAG: penicillin-binding protein 1C [Bacteroidales bacterium]|nr:penicillin-binding protein 1C [Bacteroidales bacterium]